MNKYVLLALAVLAHTFAALSAMTHCSSEAVVVVASLSILFFPCCLVVMGHLYYEEGVASGKSGGCCLEPPEKEADDDDIEVVVAVVVNSDGEWVVRGDTYSDIDQDEEDALADLPAGELPGHAVRYLTGSFPRPSPDELYVFEEEEEEDDGENCPGSDCGGCGARG